MPIGEKAESAVWCPAYNLRVSCNVESGPSSATVIVRSILVGYSYRFTLHTFNTLARMTGDAECRGGLWSTREEKQQEEMDHWWGHSTCRPASGRAWRRPHDGRWLFGRLCCRCPRWYVIPLYDVSTRINIRRLRTVH